MQAITVFQFCLLFCCFSLNGKDYQQITDEKSGSNILVSEESLEIKRGHQTVKTLPLVSAADPQFVAAKNGYLIYTSGALMLAKYDPQTEGDHVYKWFSEYRRIHLYNLSHLKQVWDSSQSDYGLPICVKDSFVYAVAVENLRECFLQAQCHPEFVIKERQINSLRVRRQAVLEMSYPQARKLLRVWLSSDRPNVSSVRVGKVVEIKDFFGYNFVSKVLKNH